MIDIYSYNLFNSVIFNNNLFNISNFFKFNRMTKNNCFIRKIKNKSVKKLLLKYKKLKKIEKNKFINRFKIIRFNNMVNSNTHN